MNAIYARQSVERADSISVPSQIEFCLRELGDREYRVYSDRGFSGKNTDRPAFAAMMADVRCGLIRRVVVYKLDRISRSILDFSSMMETFEQYGVEFISTVEKFDTASPMGRAMLNICIVFAQLERETIQKRVADAYYSRSRKGLYMGGRVPFGFRLVPYTVNGTHTSKYEAVPDEAEQVSLIYTRYADPACSYADIASFLARNGLTKRGASWSRASLAALLKNPIYVRADLNVYRYFRDRDIMIVNPPEDFIGENGCYLYQSSEAGAKKDADPQKGYLVLAPHAGIVPAELWLKCRSKCADRPRFRPAQKAENTWLAGKIKCALCGCALIDKHYAPSHRYLFCSGKMQRKGCPGPGTLYSDEVEDLVCGEIRSRLCLIGQLTSPQADPLDSDLPQLNLALIKVQDEISTLMSRLSASEYAVFQYVSHRITALDEKKRDLTDAIARISRKSERSSPMLDPLSVPWTSLSFPDKRRVCDLLISSIHVTAQEVTIRWRI